MNSNTPPTSIETRGQFVHQWFAETAGKMPDRIAVECGPRRIAFSALDRHARAIAARLAGAGATPGDRVAIVTGDRVQNIASVLGVLKAGCVFVPLDPRVPAARLQAMVEVCRPLHSLVDDVTEFPMLPHPVAI